MPDVNSVQESQTELLRRMAAQDRSAVAEFYDQTAAAFYSFAFNMLGDTGEAEEVVQDVFVQIWNKAQSFDPAIGQAFHWAMGIARNRCIDRLRARKRRTRVLVEMKEGAEEFDTAPDTATEPPGLAEHELGVVRSALDTLPREQAEPIQLAFFGGLTHQEIAGRLNQPLGTIKARIRRGMLKLRESLQAYA